MDTNQYTSAGLAVLTNAERTLAVAGKRILAIRSIRERTGLGLKECKESVDAVEFTIEEQHNATVKTLENRIADLERFIRELEVDRDRFREERNEARAPKRTRQSEDTLRGIAEDLFEVTQRVYGTVSVGDFETLRTLESRLRDAYCEPF